jgi:hypothetical protein
MKRIAIPALLLACFAVFSAGGSRNADEVQQMKKPRPPTWEKLSESVQVLKLWKGNEGPKWPQVAVLLLSADEYEKYLEAPEDFVNGHKVFAPSSTHKIFGCDYALVPKTPAKSASQAQCMVILKHEHTTTSTGSSSCALEW